MRACGYEKKFGSGGKLMAYNFEFLQEKYQDTTREEGRFLESRAAAGVREV